MLNLISENNKSNKLLVQLESSPLIILEKKIYNLQGNFYQFLAHSI